jgi:hypothetical protein
MSTGTPTTAGQRAGGEAKQKVQEATGQAQEKAQEAAIQARGKLREQLDQRSTQAAEQINSQASDLRSVSESLREQGKEGPAKAADRLAGYVENVGGYLRQKDSDALLADAEDFGRRQPWAVSAAALALGFAAARFLKASSRERYSSRYASPPAESGYPQPASSRASSSLDPASPYGPGAGV